MKFHHAASVVLVAILWVAMAPASVKADSLRMIVQSVPEAGAKCFDAHDLVPGTGMRIWGCNNTVVQIFSYDETSRELKIGGLCIESRGRGDPEDAVGLGSCNGGANQHWRMVETGGNYRIVGGNGLCIAIKGADTADGAPLNIENCQDRANQIWRLVEAPAAAAAADQAQPALYPAIAAQANDVKEANNAYLKVKCDGAPTKQLEAARSLRDGSRDQLSTLIASDVSQLPEVQGALAAATDAGQAAAKTAADPKASDQEKAAAQAKLQIAKSYLNEVAKTARERIELKLKEDTGMSLAAAEDDCPAHTNKRAEHKEKKAEHKRPKKEQANSSETSSSQSSAPPSSGVPFGIGIGGFGGGRRFSDIRLKEDIVPIGRLGNGIGLYRFRYKGDDHTVYVGVMAQEVQKIVPRAVSRDRDGFLRVDYDRLGIRFMTWNDYVARGGPEMP